MGMTPTLRDDPQPVVEGWAMDLYCRYTAGAGHDIDTWGISIGGVSRADARRQAQQMGWKLHRDGTASCPSCVRKLGL